MAMWTNRIQLNNLRQENLKWVGDGSQKAPQEIEEAVLQCQSSLAPCRISKKVSPLTKYVQSQERAKKDDEDEKDN